MSHHDEKFRDDSGIIWFVPGLAVLIGMNCLPATIFWSNLLLG